MTPVDAMIDRLSRVDTGRPLLADPQGGRRTAFEFAARVKGLAGGLQGLGLKPGATVGLLSLNSIAFVEVLCATICAGLVSVPLNFRWSEGELAYALDDADVELLFVDSAFAPVATALAAREGRRLKLVAIDFSAEGMLDYEPLASAAPARLVLDRDPAEPCLISYTGGTTGLPKGVVHSHRSLMASAMGLAMANVPSKGRSYLICVPMFHTGGFAFLFSRLWQGDTLAILPQFRLDLLAAAVRDLRIDEVGLVPTMLQMLISDPAFDLADFATVKRLYYGSSSITLGLLMEVMERIPDVEMVQLFGMTEAGAGLILEPAFHHGPLQRLSGTGQPLPLTSARIENDAGAACAPGEPGEMVIYGPTLMTGYHGKPAETAAAFRAGGLRTGDIGVIDDLGVISLIDRAKDMIVTGGENVYSAEVESVLALHPAVAAVAVIGIADERFGEAVHAVVVPRPGHSPTLDELRRHAQSYIAGYKCPRSIQLVDHLPMSSVNKILKAELRKKAIQGQAN